MSFTIDEQKKLFTENRSVFEKMQPRIVRLSLRVGMMLKVMQQDYEDMVKIEAHGIAERKTQKMKEEMQIQMLKEQDSELERKQM